MKTTIPSHNSATIPPHLVAEKALSSPTILGHGDELWAAWACSDGMGTLVVRHGAALTQDSLNFVTRTVVATGADPVVGLASLKDKIYVAWSTTSGAIYLAGTLTGTIWDPPILVPGVNASGGVCLVEHDLQLYILFVDANTGSAAITSWSGNAFQPVTSLGVPANSVPAGASVSDPLSQPTLYVIVGTGGRKTVASRCYLGNVGALASTFREVSGLASDVVSMVALHGNDGPELALGVLNGRKRVVVSAQLLPDPPYLAVQRQDQLPANGGDLARLGVVDGEMFLGWRDAAEQVTFANYIHACRLDPADPRANRPCDLTACSPDPRLVCAAGPPAIQWIAARIKNALKGDLILSPADGNGIIGTLLGAVKPPQRYDHMGIMLEDQTVIRHCTESKTRILDPNYYTGVLLIQGAPTNGLREDHLTYGWPGTITQTIEDGFYTGLRGTYNSEWSDEGLLGGTPPAIDPAFLAISPDERANKFPQIWKSLQFVDPEENFVGDKYRYEIQNLPSGFALHKSSDPQIPDEFLWPIVVRPPVAAERQLPWVRPLLRYVADAALTVRGHYRFYSYSRSAIAIDGTRDPPPAGAAYWTNIKVAMTVEDPITPPGPVNPDDPVGDAVAPNNSSHIEYVSIGGVDWPVGTRPMVCSTFVWAAVRAAEKTVGRRITLEGPVEALGNQGKSHRPGGALDGVYTYTEAERIGSATALHTRLLETVTGTLHQQQSGVIGLIADTAAAIAGLADTVATQACNCFALDRANEISSRLWEHPGPGEAVGPDDILLHWDAPSGANGEEFRGLYGESGPALLIEGGYQFTPTANMQLAEGMAHVRAHFQFTDPTNGDTRILPTIVRIGCRVGYTDMDGNFYALVGGAPVQIDASAWDEALGVWARYEGVRDLKEGVDAFTIELQPPPLWRRRILCFGETHIYHNPEVGAKGIDTQPIASSRVLAWDPELEAQHPPANVWDYMTQTAFSGDSTKFDDTFVSYRFAVAVRPDGSVDVDGQCTFTVDGDVQGDQTRTFQINILPDGIQPFKYEVTSDSFLDSNNYGRVVLTIRNDWAKY